MSAPSAERAEPTGSRSLRGLVLGDRYRLRELIGRGGHGRVYSAEHITLGFPVAVKVMQLEEDVDESQLKRFERESVLAARLRHRNIAAVHDYGVLDDGSPYLVMEHVEGPDLASVLAHGDLDAAAAVEIGVQLLAALTALHEQGIVHRDIKPHNIMLRRAVDGAVEVKLIDFGIARTIHSEAALASLTARDSVLGTPHYMAPEQVRGATVNVRTDLYSAGVVLYEALTGCTPFDAPTPAAVLARIITTTPESILVHRPELPTSLAAIVDRAIRSSPAERFGEPSEMARALRGCASELGLARGADAWSTLTEGPGDVFGTLPVKLVRSRAIAAPLAETLDGTDSPRAPGLAPRLASWLRSPRAIGVALAGVLGLILAGGFALADDPTPAQETGETRRQSLANPDAPIELRTGGSEPLRVAPPRVEVATIESRARAAFLDGREVEAMHLYGRAAELAPERASAWRGLGLSAMAAGSSDTAERALTRYLELAPHADDRAMVQERLGSLRAPSRAE